MSIRGDIDKLKQTTGQQSVSEDELRLLIECVGRRDALFAPWRLQVSDFPQIQRFPAISERQRDYLAGVQGVSSQAEGATDWKPTFQHRKRLVALGLASAVRAQGQSVTSLLITESGDAAVQAALGVSPFAGIAHYLKLRKAGRPMSEAELFGIDAVGSPADWCEHEESMLPLLVRGIVRAVSDMDGRIVYALGDAGLPEQITESKEARRPWAMPVYFGAYHTERAALAATEYQGFDCHIPLPSGSYQKETT